MQATAAPEAPRLTLDGSPELATNCYFVGTGSRADAFWSHDDFTTICRRLLNGNRPNDFLLCYRDKTGKAKFGKAHRADAGKRTDWAWDTATGQAERKTGIGFYPRDAKGRSCWAALDFDSHNENERQRARDFAIKAFQLLVRHPELWVISGTSGASGGWHLFAFSEQLHPCADWAKLLREVADKIGAPIQKGTCELFPSDSRGGFGIRAPGTWNPKDNSFGLIAFDNATPRLKALSLPKESSASLYARPATRENTASLPIGEKGASELYRGEFGEWASEFAISAARTRHEQLAKVVGAAFFQRAKQLSGAMRNCSTLKRIPLPKHP